MRQSTPKYNKSDGRRNVTFPGLLSGWETSTWQWLIVGNGLFCWCKTRAYVMVWIHSYFIYTGHPHWIWSSCSWINQWCTIRKTLQQDCPKIQGCVWSIGQIAVWSLSWIRICREKGWKCYFNWWVLVDINAIYPLATTWVRLSFFFRWYGFNISWRALLKAGLDRRVWEPVGIPVTVRSYRGCKEPYICIVDDLHWYGSSPPPVFTCHTWK